MRITCLFHKYRIRSLFGVTWAGGDYLQAQPVFHGAVMAVCLGLSPSLFVSCKCGHLRFGWKLIDVLWLLC